MACQLWHWQNEWYEVADIWHSTKRQSPFHRHNTCGTDGYLPHRHVKKPAKLQSWPWHRSRSAQSSHPKRCAFRIWVLILRPSNKDTKEK